MEKTKNIGDITERVFDIKVINQHRMKFKSKEEFNHAQCDFTIRGISYANWFIRAKSYNDFGREYLHVAGYTYSDVKNS